MTVSQAKTPQAQVVAHTQLALELVYIDNMLAEQHVEQARAIAMAADLSVQYLHQLEFVYCHIFLIRSEYQQLWEQSKQLLTQAELSFDRYQELLFLQGRALIGLNRYDEALEVFQQTFRHAKVHQLNMALPYLGFALVSNRIGRHEDALQHTITALEYVDQENTPSLLGQILITKASIESRLGQTAQAQISAEQAAELFRALNYSSRLVLVLGNLGRIYQAQENYERAFEAFLEANQLAQANHMTYFVALTLESLGTISMFLKRFDAAERYLHESLQISQQIDDKRGVYNAYFCLAELFEMQEKYEQAYTYLSLYNKLYVEFYHEQMTERIVTLEVEHQTAQAEAKAEAHRQQAEKLATQKAQAEQIAQYKEKLLNEASHDLKHPLTAIYLNLQRLRQRESLSQNGHRIIGHIESSVHEMKALLEGVLEMAALQVSASLNFEIVSLTEFFDVSFWMFQGVAMQKQVQLIYEQPPPFDDQAQIDRQQFRRVLNNVLSNGIKYTPSGGCVSLDVGRQSDELFVKISDEGVGIAAEELPYIFEQFYRASSSAGINGTGLGLAITKEIVERHQGRINVQSELGKGTMVTIWLPAMNTNSDDAT